MTSAVSYEPFVTSNLNKFFDHVDQRFAGKKGAEGIMDLPAWMTFFAIDGIGELTNSASYGLIEAGRDKDGIFAAMQSFLS